MKADEIQEEIERTRGEMASTLDAIERKLSPRQLMDQAVDTMRGIASDQSRVGTVVRDNPIPLALIGLGLGWLAVSSLSSSRRRSADEEEAYGSYESYEGVGMQGVGVAPTVTTAWDSPGTTASPTDYSGYETGGDGQSALKQRANEASEQARQKVSQWSRTARSQASQAADRTWEAYQEHPVTMGFLAMMMGAALGAIIPRSQTETEMIGAKARGALRQAREAAGNIAERAGQVAEKALETAREQGKEALREVTESGKEEAQRQGLAGGPGSTMTH